MSVHNNVYVSATLYRGRKLYGASNNSVQELRLDDTLNSLRSETSAICLPAIFSIFSRCFCYGNDSPLTCHWSGVKKALDVGRFFFFRKVEAKAIFST